MLVVASVEYSLEIGTQRTRNRQQWHSFTVQFTEDELACVECDDVANQERA